MKRRSFLALVAGGGAWAAAAQTPRPSMREYGCSDRDPQSDLAWSHGSDNDVGPRADPVRRYFFQDGSDPYDAYAPLPRGPRRICPRKRQIRSPGPR